MLLSDAEIHFIIYITLKLRRHPTWAEQDAAVAQALGETREALAAARAGVSYDAVCVCIQGAADALLELTGEKASQAVVDQVFSRFCVGK